MFLLICTSYLVYLNDSSIIEDISVKILKRLGAKDKDIKRLGDNYNRYRKCSSNIFVVTAEQQFCFTDLALNILLAASRYAINDTSSSS